MLTPLFFVEESPITLPLPQPHLFVRKGCGQRNNPVIDAKRRPFHLLLNVFPLHLPRTYVSPFFLLVRPLFLLHRHSFFSTPLFPPFFSFLAGGRFDERSRQRPGSGNSLNFCSVPVFWLYLSCRCARFLIHFGTGRCYVTFRQSPLPPSSSGLCRAGPSRTLLLFHPLRSIFF